MRMTPMDGPEIMKKLQAKQRKLAPARIAPSPGYRGPIPLGVYSVLELVWQAPVSLASDVARTNRISFAFAASVGWISIIRPDGLDIELAWRLTAPGLHALEDHHNLNEVSAS